MTGQTDRMPATSASDERAHDERFRRIFRRAHAGHDACQANEWLDAGCTVHGVPAERPIVWSRRNGPWRRVRMLWVGAAPGNAGGRGGGDMGAHGTLIPFGGDIAGANLEVMLGSIGATRNDTFIVAALNQLPLAGGGEPKTAEILAPVGDYPDSLQLLADTIVAAGPELIIALGNVAARVVATAWLAPGGGRLSGPSLLRRAGWERGSTIPLAALGEPDPDLSAAWYRAWGTRPTAAALWLTHPSAQNMSPHAGVDTLFHSRMTESLGVLRSAVRERLGIQPPDRRPDIPDEGIYALPVWRERIGPRTTALDRLWREKGV